MTDDMSCPADAGTMTAHAALGGGVTRGGGGGWSDSNMKMPGRVCQESEKPPVLNHTFVKHTHVEVLKGSSYTHL